VTRGRAVAWVAAGVVALALIWASPIGNFAGFFLYVVVRSIFPSMIEWGDKDAYVKCSGAIADPRLWPAPAGEACEAMFMCANEAVLSDQQRKALYAQARSTPGCGEP
jgi:hypothetical protein